ncbi:HD domain-containing protein [bacterium]|nr:HD domain-containing protein [bacterium]
MELFKNLGYILVCSADTNDVHMLRGLLTGNQFGVQTCSTFYALMAQIKRQIPRIIILDSTVSIENVAELCALRDSDPYIGSMQILCIAPIVNVKEESELFQCGIDGIIYSPMSSSQVINRVNVAFERSIYLEEREGFEKLLFSLTSAYDARETNNSGHPERVAQTSRRLGRRLGLSETDQTILYKGGMLHDIGMIKVPRDIMYKHGALDTNEYEIVKTHTIWGERLCSPVRSLEKVLPLVRHHHEMMDGSGYPDGLKGKQIPELARIVAICEVFDALQSERPHRPAMKLEEAIECLQHQAKRNLLDPDFVKEFVEMMHDENDV